MPEIAPLRAGDPERLGPYRLIGLLGEGGQGSVFVGEEDPPEVEGAAEAASEAEGAAESKAGADAGAGRRVAIKLLHARLSGDPRARARFAAELRTAQRVAPFCTARILDSDVEGDRPYIVSEYIDGPSLAAVIADEGPRSGDDLDRLAIGTMTALAAIHQAGVVHRDFKPANVLLAPDGPRVIDFGIARALDATGTLSSTAVGTPAYMAPEQISGGPVGPQADIFAWGATMIYAATGRPAFGQDSIPAVMHRILNFPPDLGSLAEPLRGLVQACLHKQAAYRPSSQQVLFHLLRLAGSLPQAGGDGAARDPDLEATAIINHGAEVVSTDTAVRLASVPGAAVPGAAAPGAAAPGAAGAAVPGHVAPAPPGTGGPSTPPPIPYPQPQQGAWAPPPPPGAFQQPRPPGPPAQPWGTPGTRPGGVSGTVGRGHKGDGRGRRRIGVLAGAGSAALVALIVAGSAIAVKVLGDDDGGTGPRTGPGRTGGEFKTVMYDLTPEATGLAPSNAAFGTERMLAKQLFTGLVEIEPDGTARNRLAARITPDSTCRSWKIEVRSGTRFHNGEPVDADAFVRGWTRAAQVKDGLAETLIGDVRGFEDAALGKTPTLSGLRSYGSGFQVDLDKPDCDFPKRLGDPILSPVAKNAGPPDNTAYNEHPVGNGPFKIESYVEKSRVTLVRNDAWAFGKAKLDKVVVDLSSDVYAKGPLGFTARLYQWTPVDVANAGAAPREPERVVSRATRTVDFLAPITTRGPMSSRNARIAVSYALDRKVLNTSLYHGTYQPATGILPPGIPGFSTTGICPSCQAHNADEARRYAQLAKLGSGSRVRLYARGLPTQRRLAEAVQGQLQRVLGWSVELKFIEPYDFNAFIREVTSKDASGLALLSWMSDYPSAHRFLRQMLSSQEAATADNGKINVTGWRNDAFERIIGAAPAIPDEQTRNARLRDAEVTALNDMALIPVLYRANVALRSDRLVNLDMDYDGDPTLGVAAYR